MSAPISLLEGQRVAEGGREGEREREKERKKERKKERERERERERESVCVCVKDDVLGCLEHIFV